MAEYHNDASQHEKRETLRNDTNFSRQQNAIDDAGGRFSKIHSPTLTGSNSSQQVPQQPPNSFWAKSLDEVSGIEPPFGVDINAVEATGTPVEVEQSLEKTVQPED